MNQKQIGTILIIIGLILAIFVYYMHQREARIISEFVSDKGSCFLDDGTCLHEERNPIIYIIGWIISAALITFGIYLAFFDRTQKVLLDNQKRLSEALLEASKKEKEKDEFAAFLSGFSAEEQKVLKAIHFQDGIKQSTLRYKTGISKSSLSLILRSFEEKKIISRRISGKTKQVFLQKNFK
jgi:uncharacterized membrane protein